MTKTNLIKETIETPYGNTLIKKTGSGPPILILHGGPGFTHNYLVDALQTLSSSHTLIFYDQPSFTDIKNHKVELSPSLIQKHFRWMAEHLSSNGEPISIIAHSWGSLVFVASLLDPIFKNDPKLNFSNILLINPMPISSDKLKLSSKNLMKRFSLFSKLKLFTQIILEKDGNKIMETLLPYYVNNRQTMPTVKFNLDKLTYLQITKQLIKYDFTPYLSDLPQLSIMLSENDFITPDHIESLLKVTSNSITINNSGHFPFWENQQDFQKGLSYIFKK